MPTPTPAAEDSPASPPLLTAEEREAIEGRDAVVAVDYYREHPSAIGEVLIDRRRLLQAYSAMEKEREDMIADKASLAESLRVSTRAANEFRTERNALSARCVELEKLLAEARPIVFEDHVRELGTSLLKPYTLTARIDAALEAK